MKISEHELLRIAFESSFAFMLNRIEELDKDGKSMLAWRPAYGSAIYDSLMDSCFNEFMIAIDDNGISLEETRGVNE